MAIVNVPIFGIVSSALAQLGNFLVRKATVTAVTFAALYWASSILAGYVLHYFASHPSQMAAGLQGSLSQILMNPHMAFFIEIFQINKGIKIILSAYTARFLIRRIPFFG